MSVELDVLIVEDSETDAKLVVRELSRSGFRPRWERVDTPESLREALLRKRWHVVISDSSVVALDPARVLLAIREHSPDAPMIIVSGAITKDGAMQAIHAGAADFIAKDRIDRLGQAVARELRDAGARQGLSVRLLAAQEAERRRIARSLHDQFGQILTALKLTLESARKQRGRSKEAALKEADALVDQAMQQARDLSVELFPTILDDLGLMSALRWLAGRQARWTKVTVQSDPAEIDRLPFPLEVACFRIAQEALTNVARHAGATQATVDVRVLSEQIELLVIDDGSGFGVDAARRRASSGASLGLVSMQERAILAGGRIEIDSRPGSGTTVRARFPRSSHPSP